MLGLLWPRFALRRRMVGLRWLASGCNRAPHLRCSLCTCSPACCFAGCGFRRHGGVAAKRKLGLPLWLNAAAAAAAPCSMA